MLRNYDNQDKCADGEFPDNKVTLASPSDRRLATYEIM